MPHRASEHPLLTNERGQALAFLLIWMIPAIALVAMTVGIGQAVSRRAALQLLTDASAYTGATAMAVGMNALAKVNRELLRLWDRSEPFFENGVPCIVSDQAVDLYDGIAKDLGEAYEQLNEHWQEQPTYEAQRLANYNLQDLFPGESQGRFTQGEADRSLGLRLQRDPGVLVVSSRDFEPRTWFCTRGWHVEYRSHRFARHYVKSSAVTSFAWVVQAPPGRALLAEQFFGPAAVPAMRAAAVAKPVGGSIEHGRATYVSKMIPLDTVGVRTVRTGVPGVRRPVTH